MAQGLIKAFRPPAWPGTLKSVAGMAESLALADLAIAMAAGGVMALVRQLWPARRSPFPPLAAVLIALAALALAVTGGRVPRAAAGVLLAAVVASRLIAIAGHARSRLRARASVRCISGSMVSAALLWLPLSHAKTR